MKNTLVQNKLIVKKSLIHGYGVFTTENIAPGEVFEECYALLMDKDSEEFNNYCYAADEKLAVPLGFGCIYNHSDKPNATSYYNSEHQIMIFTATEFIPKGAEIYISYGKNWFDGRRIPVKSPSFLRKIWLYSLGLPLRAAIVFTIIFLTPYVLYLMRA